MILRSRLKRMAQPKDCIEKAEKKPLTHQMISPLITKIKSPKVIMVTGMVSKISKGLIRKLKRVSTRATGIAVAKFFISAPGKSLAVSHTEIVKTINVAI
jgi:hypothetical protein